jgi:hypothetical protein
MEELGRFYSNIFQLKYTLSLAVDTRKEIPSLSSVMGRGNVK